MTTSNLGLVRIGAVNCTWVGFTVRTDTSEEVVGFQYLILERVTGFNEAGFSSAYMRPVAKPLDNNIRYNMITIVGLILVAKYFFGIIPLPIFLL